MGRGRTGRLRGARRARPPKRCGRFRVPFWAREDPQRIESPRRKARIVALWFWQSRLTDDRQADAGLQQPQNSRRRGPVSWLATFLVPAGSILRIQSFAARVFGLHGVPSHLPQVGSRNAVKGLLCCFARSNKSEECFAWLPVSRSCWPVSSWFSRLAPVGSSFSSDSACSPLNSFGLAV
jgi:hypothetical protein